MRHYYYELYKNCSQSLSFTQKGSLAKQWGQSFIKTIGVREEVNKRMGATAASGPARPKNGQEASQILYLVPPQTQPDPRKVIRGWIKAGS